MSAPGHTPPPASRPPGNASDRLPVVAFGVMLVVALWMLTRSWNASILDRYEFRQLQTALTIHWMQQDGFHLDYLTPLFGPPWSVPMEFPVYQACVAGLASLAHWPLEQTGRLVGIVFFLATLPAVYDLLGFAGLARSRRFLVLAIVLSTPVYLFYTRAVMIETAALCFAVWFLCLLRRMLEGGNWRLLPAVTLFALLAALTKVTTFVVYAVPAGLLSLGYLFSPPTGSGGSKARAILRTGVMAALPVAIALAVTLAWVAHADAVKDSNPFSGFLNSHELHQWNYGTPALRFDPSFWKHLLENVTQNQLSEGALAVALLCLPLASPRARRLALGCLAGFLAGPLVFANLYHIHDYYYTANALLLTGAAGLVLASAWDNHQLPAAMRGIALTVILLFQYLAFDHGYHYYYWKPAPQPPDLGAILRETVPTDGVILIYGADWNPLLPYYAQRRALMVPGDRDAETKLLEDVVARLPPYRIAAMVLVGDKARHRPDFIKERAARFGFSPEAFASSPEADLYLPIGSIPQAAAKLQGRRYESARLLVTVRSPLADYPLQSLSGLDLPFASPSPVAARSRFGISAGQVEGRTVINAHAPSELIFAPQAGFRHIRAVVGLPAAAHAQPPPAGSDGIGIDIFVEGTDGLRRSIYHRSLDPSRNAGDRGPQEFSLDLPEAQHGRVVFGIDPGPAGNITNDWAYWARIEIR